MADPIDVSNTNVYYSTDGTDDSYAELPHATGYAHTAGVENETTVRTFGGGKHVRIGDSTDDYDISALFDRDGQSDFRDALRNKTTIFIAIVDADTAGSEVGQIQECKITQYTIESDIDGDYVRASFTATGEGTLSEITELPTAST